MCKVCHPQPEIVYGEGTWNPDEVMVTPADLANAVRRAARNCPDKIYVKPSEDSLCLYTHTDDETGGKTPGCIVGFAINQLTGLYVDDNITRGAVNSTQWHNALKSENSPMRSFLFNWLRNVQAEQDLGRAWGEAVKYADEHTPFED